MSHTPGPWCKATSSLRKNAKIFITGGDCEVICEVLVPQNIPILTAAPDLLAALERFIKNPNEKSNMGWCEVFKSAIAKARGQK